MVQLLINLLTSPLVIAPSRVKQRQWLITNARTQLAVSITSVYTICRDSIWKMKPPKSNSPINGKIISNGDEHVTLVHLLGSLCYVKRL